MKPRALTDTFKHETNLPSFAKAFFPSSTFSAVSRPSK